MKNNRQNTHPESVCYEKEFLFHDQYENPKILNGLYQFRIKP